MCHHECNWVGQEGNCGDLSLDRFGQVMPGKLWLATCNLEKCGNFLTVERGRAWEMLTSCSNSGLKLLFGIICSHCCLASFSLLAFMNGFDPVKSQALNHPPTCMLSFYVFPQITFDVKLFVNTISFQNLCESWYGNESACVLRYPKTFCHMVTLLSPLTWDPIVRYPK